jgi:predicted O-methyltransferase YrrM
MMTAEAIAMPDAAADFADQGHGTGSFEVRAMDLFSSLGHRVPSDQPRIAHVGCRSGSSTIALARRFPAGRAVGIECSESHVQRGREAARRHGLEGRVHFHLAPSDQIHLRGRFDLIVVSDPVRFHRKRLLPWLRTLLSDDGAVVLAGAGAAALGREAKVGAYREIDVAYLGCGRVVCVLTA